MLLPCDLTVVMTRVKEKDVTTLIITRVKEKDVTALTLL